MSNNTTDNDYESGTERNKYLITIRMLYFIGFLIICSLGLVLNFLVIVAGMLYHHKSDTAKWVIALAVTHLICSGFLPLQILYSWYHFNWHYGAILCKVLSYIFYVSLFSTAGILSLWSAIDGIGKIKCKWFSFQHSSVVMIMILCSWTFAAVLGIPSLYSRELRYTTLGQECIDDYDLFDEVMTEDGKRYLRVVVFYRFLLGILIPAFLTAICSCCRRQRMGKILNQITCLIKMVYFVCWTPLLFMGLLQAFQNFEGQSYGLPIATVLAAAHCCVNPVIYFLVSQDLKMKWMTQPQTVI
ncbi:chemokine-like receptor 1 [Silurus meridionalis]|uniref:G-protein coupled receptors family 1 profile domain-containing protein n=2 Tax=Silurus meridionalis TaxID=175797 RepID=A0A8T0A8N5_SILME|nr:hypothetical protein HF521_014837 [Silurus meridionalis]KAI5091351.1 chemokine-like receptor 1 [Silurus meridionalis]